VAQLDLSAFEPPRKAVEGQPGAPPIPTALLFALWLQATSEGLSSARHLAELCTRDLPYQWLCGGDPVNYHTLADFYADHGDALRALFVEHIAALRQHRLLDLTEVTLDGRKVPANAAKESFHRLPTLERHLAEAEQHLRQVQRQRAEAPARSARQAAARRRAARERRQRLQQAVAQARARQQQRRQTDRATLPPAEARASETDPDAVKMKRPDGGYRPCYNVQTLTTTAEGLIVTVAVTAQSSDNGQLRPLVEQVQREQGVRPGRVLADSGFSDQDDVQQLEEGHVAVLMPPKNERKELAQGKDPYARKRRDSEVIAAWRARLGTAEARQRYRRRAPVAEGVHAQQANRGWQRFRLRGLVRAAAEACWQALTHNLLRLLARGVDLAGTVRAAGR
jgi:transposase